MDTLLIGIALALGAFFLGTTLFTSISYALAHRHEPRGLRPALGDAVRELALTLLVQPLLPLFWIIGRRLGPRSPAGRDPGRRPVVFVHGYAQNRVDFLFLASRLRRRGFDALFGFNYAWVATIEASAEKLDRFVEEVCAECEADRVDLVCHSMGGLVAMQYLHSARGQRRVARCVSIATPFGGVRWRGPLLGRAAIALRKGFAFPEGPPASLPVALLSVFSRHDNVVHPASTTSLEKVRGRHHEAGTMGHLAILFDGHVADVVAEFLLESSPPARSEIAVGARD